MLPFLILVVSIVALIIWWKAAKKFEMIAEEKGYSGQDYFWWCFWLTFVGYAMVIALPDKKGRPAPVVVNASAPAAVPIQEELPDL